MKNTIKIYNSENIENGIYNLIDEFEGTMEECEKWAEENYGDTDLYAWAYC